MHGTPAECASTPALLSLSVNSGPFVYHAPLGAVGNTREAEHGAHDLLDPTLDGGLRHTHERA